MLTGYVYDTRKRIFQMGIFFLIILISVCSVLQFAFDRIAMAEAINWKETESVNLVQGNILSSVTKLQRIMNRSLLIAGVQVVDGQGDTLVKFGSVPNLTNMDDLPQIEVFQRGYLFQTEIGIRSGKSVIWIYSKAPFLYLILFIIVVYFLFISMIYSKASKKLALSEHEARSELEIQRLNFKNQIDSQMIGLARQVAHDIRSPLSALNLTLSTLRETSDNQKSVLRSATTRINDIANDLLDRSKKYASRRDDIFNKTESSEHISFSSDLRLLDINEELTKIVSEKAALFSEVKEVIIQFEKKDDRPAFVKMNSSDFARVISNLVNNSVDSLLSGSGKVIISSHLEFDEIVIKVIDNGRGIPPDLLDKVGTIPVSYGKTGEFEGNGLGLYHAKGIIEFLGGKILIISELNIGTCVEIRLMLA